MEDLVRQLAAEPGPAYLRIDKAVGGIERRPGEKAELGRARMVCDGRDVCLIAIGAIASEALAAARMLADEGISARVLTLPTLKPIDATAILAAAGECGGIVTVEEHSIIGGLGGAVAEICLEGGTAPRFFRRVGLRDCFPTIVGDQAYLRSAYGMDADAIARVARECVTRAA